MNIDKARRVVESQYRATHDRMQGNAEYEALMRAAEVEAESGSASHLARNRLALFVEINTPLTHPA